MMDVSRSLLPLALLLSSLSSPLAAATHPSGTSTPQRLQPALVWDQAFVDRSGSRPVHFTGTYVDAHGASHRVEEWRIGNAHLRRRTDKRIDLHADQPPPPPPRKRGKPLPPPASQDYVWNVVDLEKGIDHRIGSAGLLHAGLLYNFSAMAHELTRPAGPFRIIRLTGQVPVRLGGVSCEWFELTPDAQPGTHICWSAEIGAPLRTEGLVGSAWQTTFEMESLDRGPLAPAIFHLDTTGLEVRDMDQMQGED